MSTETATEVAIGGAVLAIAAGFLLYAGQITGSGPGGGSYDLHARFPSIEGIKIGTDVRLAGVKVGTVTGVQLDPATFLAELRFTVRTGIELPADSAALISSEGLLGGHFLELMPGGAIETLSPGAEVEDTQGAVSMTNLLMKFVGSAANDALAGDAE